MTAADGAPTLKPFENHACHGADVAFGERLEQFAQFLREVSDRRSGEAVKHVNKDELRSVESLGIFLRGAGKVGLDGGMVAKTIGSVGRGIE